MLGKFQVVKDCDDMCYGDLIKKLIDIRQLKEKREITIQNLCTFTPDIQKDLSNYKSKLGLELTTREYIHNLNAYEHKRNMEKIKAEQNFIQKEMEECNFRPHTTELPSYYSKIKNSSINL